MESRGRECTFISIDYIWLFAQANLSWRVYKGESRIENWKKDQINPENMESGGRILKTMIEGFRGNEAC